MTDAAIKQAKWERTGAPNSPLVHGGVVSSYRASMIERDLWEHVRSALTRRGCQEATFDPIHQDQWVELSDHLAMLEVIAETLGVDELRSLVRKRIIDPKGSNFYAPILRSWARSFGEKPENMLRGAVHVWRAAMRNAGSIRAIEPRAGEVQLVVEGEASRCYQRSPAFAATLEGLALGFLDLSQPRPVFVEAELAPKREPATLICRFRNV